MEQILAEFGVTANTLSEYEKWSIQAIGYVVFRDAIPLDKLEALRHAFDDTESKGYDAVGKQYAGHDKMTHGRHEYVRGDVTTNTIEGFFSLLKRGIYGTFHNVSRTHLQRYVDEFEFRYNHRKHTDGERTAAAIKGAIGKRLMYRDPVPA